MAIRPLWCFSKHSNAGKYNKTAAHYGSKLHRTACTMGFHACVKDKKSVAINYIQCVSVSSHFGCQKSSLQCVFSVFFVVFGHKPLYWELKTDIQKSLCMSLKNISVTAFINSFIQAYDSTAQDLAVRIHQKWPLSDQNENSMTQS